MPLKLGSVETNMLLTAISLIDCQYNNSCLSLLLLYSFYWLHVEDVEASDWVDCEDATD